MKTVLLLLAFALVSCYGQLTHKNAVIEPVTPALPGIGGYITDPVFGTRLLQVTAEADGNCSGSYPYESALNADNTMLRWYCVGTGSLVADVNFANWNTDSPVISNKRPLRTGNCYYASMVWSRTNPQTMYCAQWGTGKILERNIITDTETVLVDVPLPIAGFRDFGVFWQISVSHDDSRIVANYRDVGVGENRGFIVWDRASKSIVANHYDASKIIDEAHISKDGKYLALKSCVGYSSAAFVYVIDTDTWVPTTFGYDHWDTTMSGSTGAVCGPPVAALVRRENHSPDTMIKLLDMPYGWCSGRDWHHSYTNMGNWTMFSYYDKTSTSEVLYQNEVMHVAMDGSQRVRRYVHHHGASTSYHYFPIPEVSFDGQWVVLSSRWVDGAPDSAARTSGNKKILIFKTNIPTEPVPDPTPTKPKKLKKWQLVITIDENGEPVPVFERVP